MQVGDSIFQMRGDGKSNACRWIRKNVSEKDAIAEFTGHGPRQTFALANMADSYVAVTGGYIDSKS